MSVSQSLHRRFPDVPCIFSFRMGILYQRIAALRKGFSAFSEKLRILKK